MQVMRESTYKIYQILKQELENTRHPDALLPPERTLCERFNCGRSAVRTALQQLESDGLIRSDSLRGVRQVSLRPGALHKVYVIQPDQVMFRTSPENMGVFSGISARIYACGGEIIPVFCNYEEILTALLANYTPHEHSGVIFLENTCHDWYHTVRQHNIPAVIANFEGDPGEAVCTRMDFRKIARRGGEELLKRNYRRIALIGRNSGYINDELAAGLRGAMAEERLWFEDCNIVEYLYYTKDHRLSLQAAEAMENLLNRPDRPDAFLVFRLPRVRKLLEKIRQKNLRIPSDIGIIAYDTPGWFDGIDQDISLLEEPVEKLGSEAVDMLRQWNINNGPPENRVLEVDFVASETLRSM